MAKRIWFDTTAEMRARLHRHDIHTATAAWFDGEPAYGLLLNVSSDGVLAELNRLPRPGELILLNLPEVGARRARVVWAQDGYVGCAFKEPLARHEIGRVLLRARRGPGDPRSGPIQESIRKSEAEPDDRLPIHQRVGLIIALSTALWLMIGLLIWLWL